MQHLSVLWFAACAMVVSQTGSQLDNLWAVLMLSRVIVKLTSVNYHFVFNFKKYKSCVHDFEPGR